MPFTIESACSWSDCNTMFSLTTLPIFTSYLPTSNSTFVVAWIYLYKGVSFYRYFFSSWSNCIHKASLYWIWYSFCSKFVLSCSIYSFEFCSEAIRCLFNDSILSSLYYSSFFSPVHSILDSMSNCSMAQMPSLTEFWMFGEFYSNSVMRFLLIIKVFFRSSLARLVWSSSVSKLWDWFPVDLWLPNGLF